MVLERVDPPVKLTLVPKWLSVTISKDNSIMCAGIVRYFRNCSYKFHANLFLLFLSSGFVKGSKFIGAFSIRITISNSGHQVCIVQNPVNTHLGLAAYKNYMLPWQ